jgi:hypothetical protein
MINNSTNINKTNNTLSPEIIEHKKDLEVMTWDRHKHVAELNQLMGSQPSQYV